MSKFYIRCGTLELIYSTSKNPFDAAISTLWESNNEDVLDEYFYIDERGYRDYKTADKETVVIESKNVLRAAGWQVP